MNCISYINFGKELFNIVKESKFQQKSCLENGHRIFRLNTQDLVELTKNDKSGDIKKGLFGKNVTDLKNWTLDLKYKAAEKFKVLTLDLKHNDDTTIKGAISETNNNIIKYHYTENEYTLHTGNTFQTGTLNAQSNRRQIILPEKYIGSLWTLHKEDLLMLSDAIGIAGKKLKPNEVAKKYDLTIPGLNLQKRYLMKKLQNNSKRKDMQLLKTEENNYTAIDYIKAINKTNINRAYMFLKNMFDISYNSLIVTEDFLQEYKEAKIISRIIDEWSEAVSKLKESHRSKVVSEKFCKK